MAGRVYVDDCFVGSDWGRWTGGGHLQADSLQDLHEFAAGIGLKRAWFQDHRLPERAHYDLTRGKRDLALERGAIAETATAGSARRRAASAARSEHAPAAASTTPARSSGPTRSDPSAGAPTSSPESDVSGNVRR